MLADAVAPHKPDVLVTVINRAFRNLSPPEAAHWPGGSTSKAVIPCHHDLFRRQLPAAAVAAHQPQALGIGDRYRVLRHGEPFNWPA